MLTFVLFILMIGGLIAIHEAGHMLIAKAFNIYVKEYAIGFGPKLFSKKGKETTYTLRAIPLGGFTAMVESENAVDESVVVVEDDQFDSYVPEDPTDERYVIKKSRTFYGASPIKRICTLIAGPAFNLLAAIAIFVSIFLYNGGVNEIHGCVIEQVVDELPASKAGIESGDLVVGVAFDNGDYYEIDSYLDFDVATQLNKGNYSVIVERNGERLTLHLEPKYVEEEKRYMIGVTLTGNVTWKDLSVGECIVEGTKYTFENIGLTVQSLVKMFTGKLDMNNVSGTIGMYSYTQEAISYGFVSYLSLVGTIAISLCIMNLVPVPVFDGGRIVLTVIEMIIGKRIDSKIENFVLIIGMLLILLLFAFTTFNDLAKIFG